MTDNDPMPFGIHKGVKMANVPAGYLLSLYDNNYLERQSHQKVKQYIIDNMDILRNEIK